MRTLQAHLVFRTDSEDCLYGKFDERHRLGKMLELESL
jgi:hypothetical protein